MDKARDTKDVIVEREECLHGEGEANSTKKGLERCRTGERHKVVVASGCVSTREK
jgi:hypothetical protein